MGCILLAFALAACQGPAGGGDKASAMQLKLYRVPADQSRTIAKNLGAVLESSEFQLGKKAHTEMRVTQPFPGTVMVLAPAPLQSSIASAIDDLVRSRLHWRRLWRHEPVEESLPAEGASPEDSLAALRLRAALRQLPPASRDVLLLSEFSGLRGDEIAALLGIPAGTVASRKHNAVVRLKALLGDVAHA